MESGKVISSRRVKLNKTQQTVLAVIGLGSFIVIFSLVSSKSLISQMAFQNKVESAQQTSLSQFKSDNSNAYDLVNSYKLFNSSSTNIIGQPVIGTGNNNGTNSKIILDALPDKYDFPAVATSLEGLLTMKGITIVGISGTDTVGSTTSSIAAMPVAGAPTAVPVPFQFNVTGTYANEQLLISNLLNSIRPIDIESISMSGSDANLTMNVTAETYYQVPTGLVTSTETIKK